MKQFDVEPVSLLRRSVYGCSMVSSERTVSEDILVLAKRYRAARPNASWPVLPFFVLSRGFNRATGRFSLFVGGEEQAEGLEFAELPAGLYARIIVKLRFAFLLGREIGRAKRYFYQAWLPNSAYMGQNLEYEYHTAKSMEPRPQVELIFGIRPR